MRAIWIEIPVIKLERAMKFYQTVFDLTETEIIADEVRRLANIELSGLLRSTIAKFVDSIKDAN